MSKKVLLFVSFTLLITIFLIKGGVSYGANIAQFQMSATSNATNPASTVVTLSLTPKADRNINLILTCGSSASDHSVSLPLTIRAGTSSVTGMFSNTGTKKLALNPDDNYECHVESQDNSVQTDFKIVTGKSATPKPKFTATATFLENKISIRYLNADNLYDTRVKLTCTEGANEVIPETTLVVDPLGFVIAKVTNPTGQSVNQKTEHSGDLVYTIPEKLYDSLYGKTGNCVLKTIVKDGVDAKGVVISKAEDIKFSGKFNIVKPTVAKRDEQAVKSTLVKLAKLVTVFRTRGPVMDTNYSSVVLEASPNINPNVEVQCRSTTSNHTYRGVFKWDATVPFINPVTRQSEQGILNKDTQTMEVGFTNIVIPTSWTGYALLPSSFYHCTLYGKVDQHVAGYDDTFLKGLPPQIVTTNFDISTGYQAPLPLPEKKSSFRNKITMGPAKSIMTSKNPLNQQYDVFVPVVYAGVIDNGTVNLSCVGLFSIGNSGKIPVFTKKISIDATSPLDTKLGFPPNTTAFALPVSKDSSTGLLYGTTYACMANYTVDNIPDLRIFPIFTKVYINTSVMGPAVLQVQNIQTRLDPITRNSNMATFDVVASTAMVPNANYTCQSINSSYNGKVEWTDTDTGTGFAVRVPNYIPISVDQPGLLPGNNYNCILYGFRKPLIKTIDPTPYNVTFKISTPAQNIPKPAPLALPILRVENITPSASNQSVSFEVVASAGVENAASYVCKAKIIANGNCKGEVSWADPIGANAMVRTPVVIPIGNSNGEMLPKNLYNCVLTGTSRNGQTPVNTPFIINTP